MEEYYCEICDEHVYIKSKSKHLNSKSHIEISKCDHIILSLEDVDIDEIDETYSLYMIDLNEKFDFFKVKGEFKIVSDGEQRTEFINARSFDNRTRIWWKDFLNEVISGFSNFGLKFDYVGELKIITIVDKRDRTYDFYIIHNMHAVECAINKKVSQNSNLIKNFIISWRLPLNRKKEIL